MNESINNPMADPSVYKLWQSKRIGIPKGRDIEIASKWIAKQGINLPKMTARCLHWNQSK
jgi:hypothetical protein